MPELPEVETTRQGILPHIKDRQVIAVVVRQPSLRWPVSPLLAQQLPGSAVHAVERRGKYLLLRAGHGTLLIHLGMSGSLRILNSGSPARKHDHVDIEFRERTLLRFTDPRRFGCMLWITDDVTSHTLLRRLGPEPLDNGFDGDYLCRLARGRKAPVKSFIMDSHVVVGIGNIYACEALFLAGIHPKRAAGRVALARYRALVDAIQMVLTRAIRAGGTTLRDFTNSSGDPGYFKQSLYVYGRAGQPCKQCGEPLREIRLGGRGTVYCVRCQR